VQKNKNRFKELTKINEKTRDEFRRMGNILGSPSNNKLPANVTLDSLIQIAFFLIKFLEIRGYRSTRKTCGSFEILKVPNVCKNFKINLKRLDPHIETHLMFREVNMY
jgi:hypothetical protein